MSRSRRGKGSWCSGAIVALLSPSNHGRQAKYAGNRPAVCRLASWRASPPAGKPVCARSPAVQNQEAEVNDTDKVKGRRARWGVVAGAIVVTALMGTAVRASYNNEPFEFEAWTGRGDGVYRLSYLGVGCPSGTSCACDGNDRRFRVNVNRSYPGSDWKSYSSNSRYRRTPSGRVYYGHGLGGTNPYVCIGYSEFQWWLYPSTYWTVDGAVQNVYTWRR